MSLPRSPISRLLGRNWWDAWDYPESLLDQHFGSGLRETDFHQEEFGSHHHHRHHHRGHHRGHQFGPPHRLGLHHDRHLSCPSMLCRKRPGCGGGLSKVVSTDDNFQIFLDVQHFEPDEIEVKTVDNSVVVHCKHEEKLDEHGFVSREFSRRYVLPEGVRPEDVVSALSTSEGVLTIAAPRRKPEAETGRERVIPIQVQDSSPSEEEHTNGAADAENGEK